MASIRWVIILLLLTGLFVGRSEKRVSAEESKPASCRVAERGPDHMVLDCAPGYTGPHDRVFIFGPFQSDQIKVGDTVQSLPDIADGTVVFDAGADGTANLALIFSRRTDGAAVASIFDDRDGDGTVLIQSDSVNRVVVREAGPVVEIVAPDGWWQRQDVVNFNLDIAVDGAVRASFDARDLSLFRTDGAPEISIHVRDTDHDGKPDFEWRQIDLPVPEQAGHYRTQVMVNVEDDEAPISGSFLWPLLASTPPEAATFVKPSYFDSPPPIAVNWEKSQVTHLGEFVSSRSGNSNYFIYSIARLPEGEVSKANFENPFAFYDLSAGRYKLPTMLIRNAYFRPQDVYLHEVLEDNLAPTAIDDLYYAWRYPSEGSSEPAAPIWDYQINLVGTHEYTSVVPIGDLAVVTAPYADYPYWVTEQTWDFGALVVDETARRPNSEGIGAWGALLEHLNPESYRYMAGQIDELPLDRLATIQAGYRGEIAPVLQAAPRVYLSSVDRRLHLAGAASGVWNLDGAAEIRYRNLDGDSYIDQWQYLERESLLAQVNVLGNYGLYAGTNHVALKRVDQHSTAPLYESSPPRNHEEWTELRLHLDRSQPILPPSALDEMFSALPGQMVRFEGAQIRDVRAERGGLRFVLELQPGFSATGLEELDITGLAPGSYVVSLNDGFHAKPLELMRLELHASAAAPGHPHIADPGLLRVAVANTGLDDARNVTLVVFAGQGPASSELGRLQLDVPSGQSVSRSFSLGSAPSPPQVVRVRLEDSGGKTLFESTQALEAAIPVHSSTSGASMAVTALGWPPGAALILLALAGCAVRVVYGLRNRERAEVEP